jgi:hypothetical protein
MKTIVTNIRDNRGCNKTKSEVILDLVKASAAGGYRYTDRAKEAYESLVKEGIIEETEVEV